MKLCFRILLAIFCLAANGLRADQQVLEEVTIIGSKEQARTLPGSAYVLDEKDLEIFNHNDINKVLAEVPGIYLVPEEGFGLRPNIGIRGSGTDRSNKISLMEDGVMIAPAPYSNPDAYYFPSAGRMVGVEVLKGPMTLQEGPYTVGGAMNLLATPIPAAAEGRVLAEVGQNNENTLHANYGDSGDIYGFMLETYQRSGDGFKDIDRSNRDAGFEVEDYVGKFRLNTPLNGEGLYQQLDLKFQYSEESSNSSYLGLTDVDFGADPNRRYGLTDIDQMNNDHRSFSGNYVISVAENLDLKLLAYYNKFKRDWFKVDKIQGVGIAGYIDAANNGDSNSIAVLRGTEDANDIILKHNNREYYSKGIEFSVDWQFDVLGMAHTLTTGVRYHRDRMDRFQPDENYSQLNGSLVYVSTEDPAGSDNRKEKAEATAVWLVDTIAVTDKLDLTLALRYEDIETWRKQWADTERINLDDPEDQRNNKTQQWQPGLGLTYQFDDSWQLLAGVYQGIAPAGAGAVDDTDPEKSTNYELGLRFSRNALQADVIGFYNDYENSVRNCSVANPCTINGVDEDSGTEQLGEAEIKGLEVSAGYAAEAFGLSWPVRLSYTYTDAEISKDSDDGSFEEGDNYRYLPENQFYASLGVVADNGWDAYVSARYMDEMCTDFLCNRSGEDNSFRETDSLWIFDAVTHYQLTAAAQIYVKVDNLADEQKIVSRSPAGARPNQPRTASVGLTVTF